MSFDIKFYKDRIRESVDNIDPSKPIVVVIEDNLSNADIMSRMLSIDHFAGSGESNSFVVCQDGERSIHPHTLTLLISQLIHLSAERSTDIYIIVDMDLRDFNMKREDIGLPGEQDTMLDGSVIANWLIDQTFEMPWVHIALWSAGHGGFLKPQEPLDPRLGIVLKKPIDIEELRRFVQGSIES